MKIFYGFILCLWLTVSSLNANNQADKWTLAETIKLRSIREVQLAPDCRSALIVCSEAAVSSNQDHYFSRIFRTSLHEDEMLALTAADYSSSQPRWSPDGKWIAFLSNQNGYQNLYLVTSYGMEPTAVTHFQQDIQTFRWSPDSRYIAFICADHLASKESKGAFIYDKDSPINRLWIADLLSNDPPRAITDPSYCIRGLGDFGTINEEFDWSPDGSKIVFAYSPSSRLDDFYRESRLAILDLYSGQISPLPPLALHESLPRYSPDGRWIAYLSSSSFPLYAFNRHLAIRTSEGTYRKRLKETPNGGPFLSGPSLLGWSSDSQSLFFFEPHGTKFHLLRLSINNQEQYSYPIGEWLLSSPALCQNGTHLSFVGQKTDQPPEAYMTALTSFSPKQLSRFNTFFSRLPSFKTEAISWLANDQQKIEGLLTYPSNYQEDKRYPLLVILHGGPMSFFDESFLGLPYPYPLAMFAEAGYLIFRPNPRGSCGYGEAFRCQSYKDWGGKDFEDIMSGIDHLIQAGIADPDRLGVMGWSYGGYLTAWAITQTNRFKAASVGAGISNLVSMAGTTDLSHFLSDYLGNIWENPSLYHQRSPLYYAHKITTPCLIQHGLSDKRVPATQAFEFYQALRNAGKPVSLILYPRMGHRFSEPSQQLDLMQRNLDWFNQFLLFPSS